MSVPVAGIASVHRGRYSGRSGKDKTKAMKIQQTAQTSGTRLRPQSLLLLRRTMRVLSPFNVAKMAMKRTTYPRPSNPVAVPDLRPPRTVYLPLSRRPPQTPPRLPSRPPLPPPPTGWTSTSHVIPAAHPRIWAGTTGKLTRESHPFRTRPAPEKESSEERKVRAIKEAESCLTGRYDADKGVKVGDEPGLWMAGERWKRDAPGTEGEGEGEGEGLTLVFTHANGFTKECWHPALRRLLALGPFSPDTSFGEPESNPPTKGSRSARIEDIWLLDDVHHAASLDLNTGIIGPVHNWADGGRDVASLLERVLPNLNDGEGQGGVLHFGQDVAGKGKKRNRIIGIGHSFGANALVQAAHERPDLFHALFLVEPMCSPIYLPRSSIEDVERNWPWVFSSFKRRYRWPSTEAASAIRSTPFFATWHEESWSLFLTHHLVPHPDGGVQLATPPWCEAAVFGAPHVLEGWDKLKDLEIPVGFLMSGDTRATSGEENTQSMVWRPKQARNERIMSATHQVVQEKPDEVADTMWRFLGSVTGSLNDWDERIKARL